MFEQNMDNFWFKFKNCAHLEILDYIIYYYIDYIENIIRKTKIIFFYLKKIKFSSIEL